MASTSCGSSPCTNKAKLYNPGTSSRDTSVAFSIEYLSGLVSGEIVWDKVVLGGYEIDSQALGESSYMIHILHTQKTNATPLSLHIQCHHHPPTQPQRRTS